MTKLRKVPKEPYWFSPEGIVMFFQISRKPFFRKGGISHENIYGSA
jgi:hypothetical protein